MSQSLHDGHRERVRKELIRNGFDKNTPAHKILEFLLFYAIPRRDTNELAHSLISKFGSLSGVFEASVSELASVPGMGESAAVLLNSIVPIAKIYLEEQKSLRKNFKTTEEIGDYALRQYLGITIERAALISLTATGKLLGFDFLADGEMSSVGLPFKTVIGRLIDRNASVAVLVHNHPSGIALPSMKDVALTEQLAGLLHNIGIFLLDHIIIGGNDYISMAQSKEYAHIFSIK